MHDIYIYKGGGTHTVQYIQFFFKNVFYKKCQKCWDCLVKHVKILSDRFSPFDKSQITYLRQKNHTVVLHSSSSFVKSSRSQAVKIVCWIPLWYLLWCSPLKQIWTNISRNLLLMFIVKKNCWPVLARILKKENVRTDLIHSS